MPRHIDAEKIDFRLPYFEDENGDALVSLRAVKQCIDATPSEDVVPREELDAMRGAANSYKMHYENAKAEVAREFAEKVKEIKIKCAFPLFGLATKTEIEIFVNDIFIQMRDGIDNLVKEFTEGADNGDKQ